MLSETLRRIIADKLTTAREIGELTGAAPSTVYRWISGESEPSYTSLRLLMRLLPNRKAQQELLTSITAGTQWVAYTFDVNADVNGDGIVDHNDAIDAAVSNVMRSAESLKAMREACRDTVVTQEDCSRVIAGLDEVIRTAGIAQQVLVELSEKHARKLKLTR